MRWGIVFVVFLAGCTSPWVHKEYGSVKKADARLQADLSECENSRDCMESKGWRLEKRRRRSVPGVWVNPDVPQEETARRFRMDEAKCKTAVLTAPVYSGGGVGAALLYSRRQEREIIRTCLEGFGWEKK